MVLGRQPRLEEALVEAVNPLCVSNYDVPERNQPLGVSNASLWYPNGLLFARDARRPSCNVSLRRHNGRLSAGNVLLRHRNRSLPARNGSVSSVAKAGRSRARVRSRRPTLSLVPCPL